MYLIDSSGSKITDHEFTTRLYLSRDSVLECRSLSIRSGIEKSYLSTDPGSNFFLKISRNLPFENPITTVSTDFSQLVIDGMHLDSTLEPSQETHRSPSYDLKKDKIPIGTYSSRLPNGQKWAVYPCLKKFRSKSITVPVTKVPVTRVSTMKLQASTRKHREPSLYKTYLRSSLDCQSPLVRIERIKSVVSAPQLSSPVPELNYFCATDSSTLNQHSTPSSAHQTLSTAQDCGGLSCTSNYAPSKCLASKGSNGSQQLQSLSMSDKDNPKKTQSHLRDGFLTKNHKTMEYFRYESTILTHGLPQPPLPNRGPLNSHPTYPGSVLSPFLSTASSNTDSSSTADEVKSCQQDNRSGQELVITTDYVKQPNCSEISENAFTPQNSSFQQEIQQNSCKGVIPECNKLRKSPRKPNCSPSSACQNLQTVPGSLPLKVVHDFPSSSSFLSRLVPSLSRHSLSLKRRPNSSTGNSPVPVKRVSLHPKLASTGIAFEELSSHTKASPGISQDSEGFTRYPIHPHQVSQKTTKTLEKSQNKALPYSKGLKDWDDCVIEEAATEEDKFVSNLAALGVIKKDSSSPQRKRIKKSATESGKPGLINTTSKAKPGRKLKQGIREALFAKKLDGVSQSCHKDAAEHLPLVKKNERNMDGCNSLKPQSSQVGKSVNLGRANDGYNKGLERGRFLAKHGGERSVVESVDECLSQSEGVAEVYEKKIPLETI